MLYSTSSRFIYLISGKLYLLTTFTHFIHPPPNFLLKKNVNKINKPLTRQTEEKREDANFKSQEWKGVCYNRLYRH